MKIGRFGKGTGDFYVAEAQRQPDGTAKVVVIETAKEFEPLAIKYGFLSPDFDKEDEEDASDILSDIYPE
jgi:hypothetical protein